jgi:hypothetical protein
MAPARAPVVPQFAVATSTRAVPARRGRDDRPRPGRRLYLRLGHGSDDAGARMASIGGCALVIGS